MAQMLSGLNDFAANSKVPSVEQGIPPMVTLVDDSASALAALRKSACEEENPQGQHVTPLHEREVNLANELIQPLANLQLKVDDLYVRIRQSNIENDLQESDWINTVNDIASALQSTYHPCITEEAIERFKKDMFKNNGFTLKNLTKSIKANFAVGHLGVTRTKKNIAEVGDIIRTKYPDKTKAQFRLDGYNGHTSVYLYDPNVTTMENIDRFEENLKKISLKFTTLNNRNIPIIKISSFRPRDGAFVEEINAVAQTIGRNYKHIILDLKGNTGGKQELLLYFLSLFLGNNDPDIWSILVNAESYKKFHPSADMIEEAFNPSPSFWEYLQYNGGVKLEKDVSEKLSFKKMIVLISDKTFSAGEVAAATLKNTLGSKVCILGKPGRGSFEQAGKIMELPNEFHIALPREDTVFFSKKFHKLLTGQRLLPDIWHEDMETILDKALDILNKKTSWPEDPSYEPMIKIEEPAESKS